MNMSYEIEEQYCVPTTGKTQDPLAQMPQEVLETIQRHSDRVAGAASEEVVVSYNVVVNIHAKAPDGVAERAEQRVSSQLIVGLDAVEAIEERIGVNPKVLGAVIGCGVEKACSHPAQGAHMRTLLAEAKQFHGHQTSSVANNALEGFAGHVVSNIIKNENMQKLCGIGGKIKSCAIKVQIF